MKILWAATNPCHMFGLARALETEEVVYYSGYPRAKLGDPGKMRVISLPGRTVLTYGLLKIPDAWRPVHRNTLLRWQDKGFDRAVAGRLESGDWLIGLAGQCRDSFRQAKRLKMRTVLSHAMGPARCLKELVQEEHARAGVTMDYLQLHPEYAEREAEEYALADFHWAASDTVKHQLVAGGVAKERVWVVPYGAERTLFRKRTEAPRPGHRICFAGRLCLRKGLYHLLQALERCRDKPWVLDCYGEEAEEVREDFRNYQGAVPIHRHGPVSQMDLAAAFRRSSVLVLPSAEEGFGLVVVQALQSGLPCIVSDRVGAKDLIRHRVNGSVVPFGHPEVLREELQWWMERPVTVEGEYGWEGPAQQLARCLQGSLACG